MHMTSYLQGFVKNQKKPLVLAAMATTSASVGGVVLGMGAAAAVAVAVGCITAAIFAELIRLKKIDMLHPRTELTVTLLTGLVPWATAALSTGISLTASGLLPLLGLFYASNLLGRSFTLLLANFVNLKSPAKKPT